MQQPQQSNERHTGMAVSLAMLWYVAKPIQVETLFRGSHQIIIEDRQNRQQKHTRDTYSLQYSCDRWAPHKQGRGQMQHWVNFAKGKGWLTTSGLRFEELFESSMKQGNWEGGITSPASTPQTSYFHVQHALYTRNGFVVIICFFANAEVKRTNERADPSRWTRP